MPLLTRFLAVRCEVLWKSLAELLRILPTLNVGIVISNRNFVARKEQAVQGYPALPQRKKIAMFELHFLTCSERECPFGCPHIFWAVPREGHLPFGLPSRLR